MNQRDIILRHLQDYGYITTFEAFTEYGFTRLSAIIFDLKLRGIDFDDEWVTTTNRYGHKISFKKYILKPARNRGGFVKWE